MQKISISPCFPEVTDDILLVFQKAYLELSSENKSEIPDINRITENFREILFDNGIILTGYDDLDLNLAGTENLVEHLLAYTNTFYKNKYGEINNTSQSVLFEEVDYAELSNKQRQLGFRHSL